MHALPTPTACLETFVYLQAAGIQVVCYCAFLGAKHSIMHGSSCAQKATQLGSQAQLRQDQLDQPRQVCDVGKQHVEQEKQRSLHPDGHRSCLALQGIHPAGPSQHAGTSSSAQLQQLEQATHGSREQKKGRTYQQPPHDPAEGLLCPVALGDEATHAPVAHAALPGSGVAPSPATLCGNEGSRAHPGFGQERHSGSAQRLQLLSQQDVGVKGGVSGVKRPGGASDWSSGSSRGSNGYCSPPQNLVQQQSRLQQLGRLHQAVNKPRLSDACVQEMLTRGARLRAQRQQQPYVSKRGANHSSMDKIANYIQQVCRVRNTCLQTGIFICMCALAQHF